MAWEDEYNDLPGLDKKFRRQEQEPLLGSEQPTEQTEEQTDPLAGLDLLGGFMQDDYLKGLQTQASEAKQRQTQSMQTMQGIMDEVTADLERRRQEMKPRFTQQELDDRRAKSTAVTMLTSALANIANGIAVGRGGLNATVPDGYQAAYEHWNDVQKRHSARQAEYDKLTDAIWSNRLNKVKLEYGEASAEYQQAQAAYQKAMAQESKQSHDEQMLLAKNMFEAGKEQTRHQNKLEEIDRTGKWGVEKEKTSGQYKVSVEKEKTNREKVKAENRGVDLEDYRTYNGTNGTVTIPDDMDIEDGYLAMANAALDYLDGIQETSTNKTELANKRKALREALTGSNKDKAAKIKKLSTAIANSGVSQEELEAALNTQTQDEDGGTDVNDYWNE